VIVDTSQGQPGVVGDLTHGGGVVTLFEKKTDGSVLDCQTGGLAFFYGFFTGHLILQKMNERSFLF
jgi:hypothetical protein